MADKRRLFVNLSASQVRKRLKGHGFGVRRVEAVGRNQAAILHTATGRHLDALKSLFSDVPQTESDQSLPVPVENLRNLGPKSAQWLHEVGISTREDLERVGPVVAYQLVAHQLRQTSWNLLWALAAALVDRDWRELSDDEKRELRRQVERETS